MSEKSFVFDYGKADRIVREHTGVYLYGNGVHLRNTFDRLNALSIPVLGILDRDETLWGKSWEGVSFYSPEYVRDADTPIIICTRGSFDEIYDELTKRGFSCVLPFYFYQEKREQMEKNYRSLSAREKEIRAHKKDLDQTDAIVIGSIDVVVTERCSLRCRDCANLMQYYAAPCDEDEKVQLDALDRIMDAVDYVHDLRILGGEPFMNALSYQNTAMVTVYTNGTIIPVGENLSCLKNPKVFVRISDYGDISRNLRGLQATFEKHGISYETMECRRWKKCDTLQYRERTEDALCAVFDDCCTNRLYTLKNGRLYGCPFAANAAALGATRESQADEIRTDTDRDTLRSAIQRLADSHYYDACRYCGGRPLNVTDIPAAIQADSPIAYERIR